MIKRIADEILTKSNHKTIKNNISPLRLKEILWKVVIAGWCIWRLISKYCRV
ncbi:hypothetical protein HYD77_03040 [Mycoplasmopsis bovis]|nr:hypothetical protein [Mycoplasmopsis bovis]QQH19881.1 hypothetical protein HYE44_03065 [Mycoplasmopsis bovis]QQH43629.1 hypothetical protein HYD77_03040 [Mycoplasmopsis bovis]